MIEMKSLDSKEISKIINQVKMSGRSDIEK